MLISNTLCTIYTLYTLYIVYTIYIGYIQNITLNIQYAIFTLLSTTVHSLKISRASHGTKY